MWQRCIASLIQGWKAHIKCIYGTKTFFQFSMIFWFQNLVAELKRRIITSKNQIESVSRRNSSKQRAKNRERNVPLLLHPKVNYSRTCSPTVNSEKGANKTLKETNLNVSPQTLQGSDRSWNWAEGPSVNEHGKVFRKSTLERRIIRLILSLISLKLYLWTCIYEYSLPCVGKIYTSKEAIISV